MKRKFISCLFCIFIIAAFSGCTASRKSYNELRGLMLLDNLQFGKNKPYYSKHNSKTKRVAYKQYKKNNKALNARRY